MRYTPQWRACCEEADALLRQMGIAEVGSRQVRELPYGQQRMLEIGIALALKPRVLLLDEPAAGVPSTEAHRIHDTLANLTADIAVLIIEHDMEVIFRFAKEIVVLLQGRVLTRGAPAEIARLAVVRLARLAISYYDIDMAEEKIDGVSVTDALIDSWSKEAEAGYPVERGLARAA